MSTAAETTTKHYTSTEQVFEEAEKGDLQSMNTVGNIYKSGLANRTKSHVEAMRWFQKAADAGYGPSLFNVGFLYEKGGDGIPINLPMAAKNYMKAVDAGFIGKAIERLNIVCENSSKDAKAVDCQRFGKYQANREAQERREATDRAEQYRRDAPARQARQMCEAQKQTCKASCPAYNYDAKSFDANRTHFQCESRCSQISCN